MRDDYSTSCQSSGYEFIRAWAWMMLFVWPLGIPLLTYLFLWRHRNTINPEVEIKPELQSLGAHKFEPRERSCTTFSLRRACLALTGQGGAEYAALEDLRKVVQSKKLEERERMIERAQMEDWRGHWYNQPEIEKSLYESYQPEYWWFECFDYIRRLLLTGILVVLDHGTAAQGLFGTLVALAGVQIYSWTRPLAEFPGNCLAQAAQWTTFFTFLAALLILLDVSADTAFHRDVFAALLIAIQFMPLLIGIGVQAYEERKNLSDWWYGKPKDEKAEDETEESQTPVEPKQHKTWRSDEELQLP